MYVISLNVCYPLEAGVRTKELSQLSWNLPPGLCKSHQDLLIYRICNCWILWSTWSLRNNELWRRLYSFSRDSENKMAPLPCSAMACTGFRQALLTECDFQRLLLCLWYTFTFPRATEGSCQQNFSTSQSKINWEPYWHKYPPEERISPFLSENVLVRIYEAPQEKITTVLLKIKAKR